MILEKSSYYSDLPLAASEDLYLEKIPQERIISFSFRSFKRERRNLAKRQIMKLINKVLVRPELRFYCIQQINKLILYELGKLKFE